MKLSYNSVFWGKKSIGNSIFHNSLDSYRIFMILCQFLFVSLFVCVCGCLFKYKRYTCTRLVYLYVHSWSGPKQTKLYYIVSVLYCSIFIHSYVKLILMVFHYSWIQRNASIIFVKNHFVQITCRKRTKILCNLRGSNQSCKIGGCDIYVEGQSAKENTRLWNFLWDETRTSSMELTTAAWA